MTTMLVLFAAILNAGLGPVHQPVSTRSAVPAPVQVRPIIKSTPTPEACRGCH